MASWRCCGQTGEAARLPDGASLISFWTVLERADEPSRGKQKTVSSAVRAVHEELCSSAPARAARVHCLHVRIAFPRSQGDRATIYGGDA